MSKHTIREYAAAEGVLFYNVLFLDKRKKLDRELWKEKTTIKLQVAEKKS